MYGRTAWNKGQTKETNEIIARVSEKNRRKPAWNKGISHTEEARQKMSDSRKGVTKSESHRASLSKSKLGELNPNYGKPALNKGKRMYNNGEVQHYYMPGEEPDGFSLGKL